MGIGTFEGRAAIRRFLEDWLSSYEDFEIELREMVDLGSGVVFVVNLLKGRPVGSTGDTQMPQAWVQVWVDGEVVRQHDPRSTAQRLDATARSRDYGEGWASQWPTLSAFLIESRRIASDAPHVWPATSK